MRTATLVVLLSLLRRSLTGLPANNWLQTIEADVHGLGLIIRRTLMHVVCFVQL